MKSFARIVAPFDGIVTSRTTDVGGGADQCVGGAGQELFVVSDTKKLRVLCHRAAKLRDVSW